MYTHEYAIHFEDPETSHQFTWYYGVLIVGGPAISWQKRIEVGPAQVVIPVNTIKGLTDEQILAALRRAAEEAELAVAEAEANDKHGDDE